MAAVSSESPTWRTMWPYWLVGGVWGLAYWTVVSSCFSLLFRFLFQSMFLWNVFFCIIYGFTWRIVNDRLRADYPTQIARVKKLKILPTEPHPMLHQKTFCWVELLEETDIDTCSNSTCSEGRAALGPFGTVEQANDLVDRDPEQGEESKEKLLADIRAWSREHPCVIVPFEENVQEGTLLTVSLLDGEPSRPTYLPYQKETRDRLKWWIAKAFVRAVLSLVALYFLFGGVRVAFADSQSLEDAINGFWGKIEEKILDTFPALAADDDNASSMDDEDKSCEIPPNVAYCYDFLVLVQVLILVIVPFSVYRKSKKLYGMEEPPADSYQLLRGDEDEEELENNKDDDGTEKPPSPGHVVLL